MTLFPELDTPPALVARPATPTRNPRTYPEIAESIRQLRNARTEDQRAVAAAHACYLLAADELAAFCGVLEDRLAKELPEGWG